MTIKQKIWEVLEKSGYILDRELAEIYGKEPNFSTAKEYERAWFRLENDRKRFCNEEIIFKKHFRRRYLIKLKGMDKFSWHIVGKDFYNEI